MRKSGMLNSKEQEEESGRERSEEKERIGSERGRQRVKKRRRRNMETGGEAWKEKGKQVEAERKGNKEERDAEEKRGR